MKSLSEPNTSIEELIDYITNTDSVELAGEILGLLGGIQSFAAKIKLLKENAECELCEAVTDQHNPPVCLSCYNQGLKIDTGGKTMSIRMDKLVEENNRLIAEIKSLKASNYIIYI